MFLAVKVNSRQKTLEVIVNESRDQTSWTATRLRLQNLTYCLLRPATTRQNLVKRDIASSHVQLFEPAQLAGAPDVQVSWKRAFGKAWAECGRHDVVQI